MLESFFNEDAGVKKRLQHRCFPVRTPISKSISAPEEDSLDFPVLAFYEE